MGFNSGFKGLKLRKTFWPWNMWIFITSKRR